MLKPLVALVALVISAPTAHAADAPFGEGWEKLDLIGSGRWWERKEQAPRWAKEFVERSRDDLVAFALYAHDRGVLKLTAQLYPLLPDEPRVVRLEIEVDGKWQPAGEAQVVEPGWSAHFRVEPWDQKRSARYRARHGEKSVFEGLIRKDPADKDEIVVASLSCNSSHDRGDRDSIVDNLKKHDPDLLFFAGDQSYDHEQHTAAWLLFGKQFREVLKDRPVITIPDDHDVGHSNLWGEGGIQADSFQGDSGGYYYPVEYVNMVERCQTWHLPDPFDPTPVARGIGVYYTRLRVGGVDFAILEDRKFKTGPRGRVPHYPPPRPDHINDPNYDPAEIDVPGAQLLGDRQLRFLDGWSQDWQGAWTKVVLSQTAFCGAVHLHGAKRTRIVADLDCNGWPQSGRREALRAIRRSWACHLSGDQHLAFVVQHGIDDWRDGPYALSNPAISNTYYGRWWWPAEEKAGANPVPGSPLPWTGDYKDGLGNKITMLAYANPDPKSKRCEDRDDGYALARFRRSDRTTTFECWPRFADVSAGDQAQFPGWPIRIRNEENDGRRVRGYLPELRFENLTDPVVQVVREDDGEVLYTVRVAGDRFVPKVYAPGKYRLRVGRDSPERTVVKSAQPSPRPGPAEIIRF